MAEALILSLLVALIGALAMLGFAVFSRSVTTGRVAATGLAVVLFEAAAVVAWWAATTVRSNASTLSNPGAAYRFVAFPGLFAAGFCIMALWCLRNAWQGHRGWLEVLITYPLALVALVGVLVAAGMTGLGG